MGRFPSWIRSRARRERDLDDEIRTHIEMAVEERVARGESRADAERAARREFGDAGRVKEVTRTMWGGMWLDRLGQDLRFGVRSLRRDPSFGVAAFCILAIGIGANVVVLTLADRLFFDPPTAVGEPDDLVGLRWIHESGGESPWGYPDYDFVRQNAEGLSGVLASSNTSLPAALGVDGASPAADGASSTADGASSTAGVWIVSENYFEVLGIEMALGRAFLPEEGRTRLTHPVAVLAHSLWTTRFGGDPGILSREITLNGTPFTVVGVASPDFQGVGPVDEPPDLYVPIMMQEVLLPIPDYWMEHVPGESFTQFWVVGRLAEGVSFEQASSGMELLDARWEEAFGDWAEATGVSPTRFALSSDYRFATLEQRDRLRTMLGLLGAIVVAVLLIGCANLAILLTARATARRGEMSVRTALGAGRARLLRQLMTESVVLAVLGAAAGVVLAAWGVRLASGLLPYSFAVAPAPDGSVFLVVLALTVAVVLLFGLAPSIDLARVGIANTLRREGRGTTRARGRSLLVIGQVAGCVVVVVAAGLFGRSLWAARSMDLGFDPEYRLVGSVQLDVAGYDEARGRAFIDDVLPRLQAIAGVEAASVSSRPPFSGRWTSTVRPVDSVLDEATIQLSFQHVGPGYFETMDIPIVQGRPLSAADRAETSPAFVLSAAAAARLWPGQDPIGKAIEWRDRPWTVVGIADDVNVYGLDLPTSNQVYVSFAQDYGGNVSFVIRTGARPEGFAREMERAIHAVDPTLPVSRVRTVQSLVDTQTGTYRAMAAMAGAFGLIALFMAVTGLYGVQAYLVGQRSREIGIRMALGARAREVASSILGRGAMLSALGVAIGLVAAFGLARVLEGMLFGVDARDPATFVGVAAILMVVSLVASYGPARRASRLDPMRVLREE